MGERKRLIRQAEKEKVANFLRLPSVLISIRDVKIGLSGKKA